MNYFDLAYTTSDVLEKIKLAEQKGDFSCHLDPIDYESSEPVTERFPYKPGFFLNLLYGFRKFYFLNNFIKKLNEEVFKTKVLGSENLKNVKSAVFICNHVNKFDALVVNYAIPNKKIKIMVADFNNRKGFLGKMMRADGILPFKNTKECIKKFNDAVKFYLSHNQSVLFFPEGSEWWCYKRPRPMMDGAFHYAALCNVPVVPLFITFKESGRVRNDVDLPYFTLNILSPIYPEQNKSKSENSAILKQKSEKAWQNCYNLFYSE